MKHACVPLDSNSSLRDGSLDDIYNWIASFFRDDSHITKYGNEVSELRTISVSIIQGSGIGPPSYVVTASDLHSVVSGNVMSKLEFGMYPQSMPTEWTHARALRPWQSVRLDL